MDNHMRIDCICETVHQSIGVSLDICYYTEDGCIAPLCLALSSPHMLSIKHECIVICVWYNSLVRIWHGTTCVC